MLNLKNNKMSTKKKKFPRENEIQYIVRNLIESYMLATSARHFFYSLMYHYSPINLQKKASIPTEDFLKFMLIKFDAK